MKHTIRALCGALVLAALAAGCAGPAVNGGSLGGPTAAPAAGSIQVADAWARPMQQSGAPAAMDATPAPAGEMAGGMSGEMASGANSAAYMLIRNSGSADDTLVGVSTDIATAELHTVIDVDGVMQMRPVEGGIPVPAGGEALLKPGSFHIMLIGITRDLAVGDSVLLTLRFARAGEVTVEAKVRQP